MQWPGKKQAEKQQWAPTNIQQIQHDSKRQQNSAHEKCEIARYLHELLERLFLLWGFSHAVRATWAKT
jgi:hypothetical protein